MATYANNTNPFIRPADSASFLERSAKKGAPGMARPKRTEDVNLLLAFEQQPQSAEPSQEISHRANDNNDKFELTHQKDDTTHQTEAISLTRNLNSVSNDSDEITKACDRLVEATVQAELAELEISNKNNSMAKSISQTLETEECNFEDIELENDFDESLDEINPMKHDDRQFQHLELIKKLRLQLKDLERYAYERGELKQVPLSVLAERQKVILNAMKDKLSLNIDTNNIEKVNFEELKRQVDKEITELIDPLITKGNLLSQLKIQLTDLENYISNLHETLSKNPDKNNCLCHLHGCSSQEHQKLSNEPVSTENNNNNIKSNILDDDSLPKTSMLIQSLIGQLVCLDHNKTKSNDICIKNNVNNKEQCKINSNQNDKPNNSKSNDEPIVSSIRQTPNFQDGAAWTLHIDKVILATDSLINLFTLEPKYQRSGEKTLDQGLIESVIRRHLVPAIRDLLSYGLIDPNSLQGPSSYLSLLFDPYYLLASLTCFPSFQKSDTSMKQDTIADKFHIWHVILDYYKSKNDPNFKHSSAKTLSQSFNLALSNNGPIKITSKQALIIAIDDIIETLSKCKPNGPESHFKVFIYTALNRSRLSTWLRLIFKNKSVIRRYFHNFSFVNQLDKMNRFFDIIEPLNQFEFSLCTDIQSIEQFVSAF